jgi:hypothetical protein
MFKVITSIVMAVVLCIIPLTGCGAGQTPAQKTAEAKALLQVALSTFVAEMQQIDPMWNSAGLVTLVGDAISAWGVGANWEANVIAELSTIQADSADLPKCGSKCSGQLDVFIGGVESIVILLQNSVNTAPAVASSFMYRKNKNPFHQEKTGRRGYMLDLIGMARELEWWFEAGSGKLRFEGG